MVISHIRKTKKGPGIIVHVDGDTPEQALEHLAGMLSDFYEGRNHFFIHAKSQRETSGYDESRRLGYNVFTDIPDKKLTEVKDESGDTIDYVVESGPEPLLVRVKIEHLNQYLKRAGWDKDADYPQAQLVSKQKHICSVFFNAPLYHGARLPKIEQREPKEFLQYLQNAPRQAKV